MAAGIRAHLDELHGVSVDETRAAEIDAMVVSLSELDTKQEKFKAELKRCTAELSAQTKMLDETMQDTKKRVKLTIPQAGWQEFSISDKK